jgi:hypothetical protein
MRSIDRQCRLRAIGLCAAVALWLPGNAQTNPPSQQLTVRKISFISAAPLPSRPVQRAQLYFDHRRLEPSSLRSESLKMMRRIFIRAGYLDAKIQGTQITRVPNSNSEVDLKFEISPGELYHYSRVEVTGASVFPSSELVRLLALKAAQPVDTVRMLEGMQAIRAKYACGGYLRAETLPMITIAPSTRSIDLAILMREGAQYRIGSVGSALMVGPVADVLLSMRALQPGSKFQPCEITRAARQAVTKEQASKQPFTFGCRINDGSKTVNVFFATGFDFGYGEVQQCSAGFGGGIN